MKTNKDFSKSIYLQGAWPGTRSSIFIDFCGTKRFDRARLTCTSYPRFREESCIDNMYTMTKLITVIAFFLVNGYKAKAVTFFKGKTVTLKFIYPCESTKVTLQLSNRRPFYSSTDGPPLSLPGNQIQRFRVQNMTENGSCFLNLTITDLMTDDQGTYILFIYKDGQDPYISRVFLEVAHPPDKAHCVVGDDRGGDWVEIDCEANAGTIPGKIECFQDGIWMPPLNDRTVEGFLLKQTILIRKSQPAFCCSSVLNGNKSRCECDDFLLFQDESSGVDPCPTVPITVQELTDSGYRSTDNVIIIMPLNSTDYPLSTVKNEMKTTKDEEITIIIYSTFTITVFTLSLTIIIIGCNYCILRKKHHNRKVKSNDISSTYNSQKGLRDTEGCVTEKLNPNQESHLNREVPSCNQPFQ